LLEEKKLAHWGKSSNERDYVSMPGRIFFKKKQNLDHSCLSIVAGQILSYV
jgi:hypothetical protein